MTDQFSEGWPVPSVLSGGQFTAHCPLQFDLPGSSRSKVYSVMPLELESTGPIAACVVFAGSVPVAQAANPMANAISITTFNVRSPFPRFEIDVSTTLPRLPTHIKFPASQYRPRKNSAFSPPDDGMIVAETER